MCSFNHQMSYHDKDKIFGVKEVSESHIEGLEPRYEAEVGNSGDPDHIRQRVFRDADGSYFMVAKGGENATLGFESGYPLHGREVLIPIRPEALAIWAEHNLCGDEYERARKEFKRAPETLKYKIIWHYHCDCVFERLWKTTDNLLMLFSTDAFYPCFAYNTSFAELGVAEGGCDDLYLYYVTPKTALRWAEARGMDERDFWMALE